MFAAGSVCVLHKILHVNDFLTINLMYIIQNGSFIVTRSRFKAKYSLA